MEERYVVQTKEELTNVAVLEAQGAITTGEVDAMLAFGSHDEGVALADKGAVLELVGARLGAADNQLEWSCGGEHS